MLVIGKDANHSVKQSATSAFFRKMNDAFVLLVHLEGSGVHANADAVLFGPFRWYSPRVPAGETSAILEFSGLDYFAVRIGNGEFGIPGTTAVDHQVAALFSGRADQ